MDLGSSWGPQHSDQAFQSAQPWTKISYDILYTTVHAVPWVYTVITVERRSCNDPLHFWTCTVALWCLEDVVDTPVSQACSVARQVFSTSFGEAKARNCLFSFAFAWRIYHDSAAATKDRTQYVWAWPEQLSQWKISTRSIPSFPFGSVPLTLTRSPLIQLIILEANADRWSEWIGKHHKTYTIHKDLFVDIKNPAHLTPTGSLTATRSIDLYWTMVVRRTMRKEAFWKSTEKWGWKSLTMKTNIKKLTHTRAKKGWEL